MPQLLGQDAMAHSMFTVKYIGLIYIPSFALIVGTLMYQRSLLPFSVLAVFFGLGFVVYEINGKSRAPPPKTPGACRTRLDL
jgi:hypothetical protein